MQERRSKACGWVRLISRRGSGESEPSEAGRQWSMQRDAGQAGELPAMVWQDLG